MKRGLSNISSTTPFGKPPQEVVQCCSGQNSTTTTSAKGDGAVGIWGCEEGPGRRDQQVQHFQAAAQTAVPMTTPPNVRELKISGSSPCLRGALLDLLVLNAQRRCVTVLRRVGKPPHAADKAVCAAIRCCRANI